MAVAKDEQTEEQNGSNGSSATRTALVAAAAAAATGAAAIAARKAMSHDDQDDSGDDDDDGGDGESMVSKLRPSKGKSKKDTSSLLTSAASSAWESAQGVILPIAEDAVAAAGKYLAEEAPDVVRERLVPRFIEAFNDAS
jgi:hypothetical protein